MYGEPENNTNPWSVFWNIQEVEEFLFSSGDKKYWLSVTKKELIGEDGFKDYPNGFASINVIASSSICEPRQGDTIFLLLFQDIFDAK